MMAETSYYRPQVFTCRELAKQNMFGTIFYTEAKYHHEGLLELMYDEHGLPTWRQGLPPMHYPTHCIDIYEAIAYALPGIVAHQSAMRNGELLKIKDYGRAG